SVLAYEAGFKASHAENSIQLNGAVFYYDYEDKQERGKIQDPIFGPLDALVNVPESTIVGVETDIVALIGDHLTLSAAITYINSEVDKYVGYNVYGEIIDFSGESLPLTPDLTYSLDLDYRRPLAGGGTFFMGVNVVGQSSADAVFNGDDIALPADRIADGTAKSLTENYFRIDSYTTVGARLGYLSENERWKLMLWGKNITDEYYYNTVIAATESGARVAGRPATYGISIVYTY
ncbi:MAG: TonB-dependent receptor, partial [Porticoccaceae bacterium]